jgi:hypothetical protein
MADFTWNSTPCFLSALSNSNIGVGGGRGSGGSWVYMAVHCLAIPKHHFCLSYTFFGSIFLLVMAWRIPSFHSFLGHPDL